MSWQEQLRGDSVSWLLERDKPGVRYLALRDLRDGVETKELRAARRAAHKQGPIAEILSEMDPAGFWVTPGPGYNPKYRSTVWAIITLAQLGADISEDKRLRTTCAYLIEHALTDAGQFTASGAPSGTADCLQGNLLWAMLEMRYEDERLEAAIEWMARSVTGEGIAPISDRKATLRYYAGKCGPGFACGSNLKLPCAWGAVKVMLAFGRVPPEKRTPLVERAIRQGIEFLLSRDPGQADYPSPYTGRPNASWWKFAFPVFYVTDLLQTVEALIALGYSQDPRLKRALEQIREKQDELGRWKLEYDLTGKTWYDFGKTRTPNKWVTLRACRALKGSQAD